MKITIEHENQKATLEEEGIVTIEDAIYLVKRALVAVGYHADSVSEYIDEV